MGTNRQGAITRRDSIRTLAVTQPSQNELTRAFLILKHTHESASALLRALELVRSQRQASRGALTDEEQDLLRAMLVMSTSGLDAMVKQLIKDLLPIFCRSDQTVLTGFQEFAKRELRGDAEGHLTADVAKLLATWLTGESVQAALVQHYVGKLTGDSMQSAQQLQKAVAALGLSGSLIDRDSVGPIFDDRNRVIHELDIDFEAPNRNRRNRRKNEMVAAANCILELAQNIYSACESKLGTTG